MGLYIYSASKIRNIRKDRTDRLETLEHPIFVNDKTLKASKTVSESDVRLSPRFMLH